MPHDDSFKIVSPTGKSKTTNEITVAYFSLQLQFCNEVRLTAVCILTISSNQFKQIHDIKNSILNKDARDE